jgi:DNA repair photolyase
MAWNKVKLQIENGIWVDAQAPLIVSASRSTDIPAFYADWFFHRLRVGYSAWTNPFNGKLSYISYQDVRFIVFWSKNPKPILKYLDELKERNINCYIQFTLNDYVAEGLEKGVPSLDERIATFKKLVARLGKGHVVWRFDPLILTDKIDINTLLRKIENIGDSLYGYTDKLVFSFADISAYRKVKSNLEKNKINYKEWDEQQMEQFAAQLSEMNKKWNYQLATCGEKIDIEKYNIAHNRCIDDELMIRLAYNDNVLMKFFNVEIKTKENSLFGEVEIPKESIEIDSSRYAVKSKSNKDSGQRQFCGCAASKDIGEYNTCPHLCEYCYANASKEMAVANFKIHQGNINGETITGK